MKNKLSFVFVYWWVLVLFVFVASLAVVAEKEERVSESEKRMLSGFPEVSMKSVLSGDFFTGFEDYLSDGMFGRDQIVGISDGLIDLFSVSTTEDDQLLDELKMSDELQGIYDDNGSEIEGDTEPADKEDAPTGEIDAPDDDSLENSDADFTGEALEDAPESDEMDDYGLWMETRDGKYKILIKSFENRIKKVTETLNQYRSKLPEDGNVYFCYVPLTQTTYNLTASNLHVGWHDNIEECVVKYANEGVHYISAANIVEKGLVEGEHMFFDSDHHWTPRAAIMAVNECMKIQGIPVVPFEEYEYKIKNFVNVEERTRDDLELLYPLQDVQGNTMVSGQKVKEMPLIQYESNTYVAFLHGDTRAWEKYETGFSVGRNALVIGDSFSNAFTVYLMPYYDEVNKVDIRYFKPEKSGLTLSELIESNSIDDVYVVVSHANGFRSDNSYVRLESILHGE